MLPTSWIICLGSVLKGLNNWFYRRSCWRACRSGWFSIFWINCRTLVLCAYFTTECGCPGIRKSMSASFTIIDSWLTSWSATDLFVLLRSISSSTLKISLSWAERVRELLTSWVSTGHTVRSRVFSTLKSFLSSDERVGFTYICLNKSPRSLWRTRFFAKRIKIDLLRTGRCSSILRAIRSPRSLTNWIYSWLVRLETSR